MRLWQQEKTTTKRAIAARPAATPMPAISPVLRDDLGTLTVGEVWAVTGSVGTDTLDCGCASLVVIDECMTAELDSGSYNEVLSCDTGVVIVLDRLSEFETVCSGEDVANAPCSGEGAEMNDANE